MSERVNVDNFKRAETHNYFTKFTADHGLGKFSHRREPTPIEKQDVIRMNRDTLYSSAVVDLGAPATVVLPDAGGRFMSMQVINEDHGVEAFEAAELALDSEADINPGMEQFQGTTREIARAIKDPAMRAHVDQVIRSKAFAEFKKASPTLGDGTVRNGWALASTMGVYGKNWLLRTLVNDGGIWANTMDEVIYYKAFVDPTGRPLSGDQAYTMHFPKDQLPAQYATYFWSVIAVDAAHRRVLPNPLKRYLLNKETKPQYGQDGSLRLYFADAKPNEAPEGNWLPTPKGTGYSLTFRFYRPKGAVAQRTYFPPPLVKA